MSTNGLLPDSDLVSVAGVRLERVTGLAFSNMARDCLAATGVTLDVVNYWGGYRDREMQRDLIRGYKGPLKLLPVGLSTHGYGTAVDITYPTLDATIGWLRGNCSLYGFKYPPSWDRNHFEHVGTLTGPPPAPLPPRPEEDHMYQYRTSTNPTTKKAEWVLLNPVALPDGHLRSTVAADATGWAQIAGNSEKVPWDQFTGAINLAKQAHDAYMQVEAKKAALYNGGPTTSLQPVLDAIAGIPVAVIAEQKKPGN